MELVSGQVSSTSLHSTAPSFGVDLGKGAHPQAHGGVGEVPVGNHGPLILAVPVVLRHGEEGGGAEVEPDVGEAEVVGQGAGLLHHPKPKTLLGQDGQATHLEHGMELSFTVRYDWVLCGMVWYAMVWCGRPL